MRVYSFACCNSAKEKNRIFVFFQDKAPPPGAYGIPDEKIIEKSKRPVGTVPSFEWHQGPRTLPLQVEHDLKITKKLFLINWNEILFENEKHRVRTSAPELTISKVPLTN